MKSLSLFLFFVTLFSLSLMIEAGRKGKKKFVRQITGQTTQDSEKKTDDDLTASFMLNNQVSTLEINLKKRENYRKKLHEQEEEDQNNIKYLAELFKKKIVKKTNEIQELDSEIIANNKLYDELSKQKDEESLEKMKQLLQTNKKNSIKIQELSIQIEAFQNTKAKCLKNLPEKNVPEVLDFSANNQEKNLSKFAQENLKTINEIKDPATIRFNISEKTNDHAQATINSQNPKVELIQLTENKIESINAQPKIESTEIKKEEVNLDQQSALATNNTVTKIEPAQLTENKIEPINAQPIIQSIEAKKIEDNPKETVTTNNTVTTDLVKQEEVQTNKTWSIVAYLTFGYLGN